MVKCFLAAVIIIALFLSGCSSYPHNNGGVDVIVESIEPQFSDQPIETKEPYVLNKSFENNDLQIRVDRIDQSIIGENGNPVALIYYDKPVLTGNLSSISRINDFFENECKGWLGGSNRLTFYSEGSLDWFLESVEGMRKSESFGDSVLEVSPLCYLVDTEIIYCNQQILSIRQIAYIAAGGPTATTSFGATFDLATGELIPFDSFISATADEVRSSIVDYLKNIDSSSIDWEWIEQMYAPNEAHNYEIEHAWGASLMDFDYYYDGEYVFLIVNEIFGTSSIMIKWNGLVGDDFGASLLGYFRNPDGTYEET